MGHFRYNAFTQAGDRVQGTIEAASQSEALRLIHERGLLPFEARPGTSSRSKSHLPLSQIFIRRAGLGERAALVREIATLLKAEVTLDHSLRILKEGAATAGARRIFEQCAEHVLAGKGLSQALHATAAGFREDEIAMVAAGEQNGSLALVLDQLASLLERRLELRHKLTSALIYPSLLLVMALAAIAVIFSVLIPNIEPLFEGSDARLPAAIATLLWIKETAAAHWLSILAAMTGLAAAIAIGLRHPPLRQSCHRLMLRLPFIGNLLRKAVVSRICRTLSTLVATGVPLQQSLAATANVVHNGMAKQILIAAHEQVVTGTRLSASLSQNALFEPSAIRLIALAEETNRLHQMLSHIATITEAEVVRRIERGMTLLTPALTLALGVMIGGLIMSVMQAILSINDIAVQ